MNLLRGMALLCLPLSFALAQEPPIELSTLQYRCDLEKESDLQTTQAALKDSLQEDPIAQREVGKLVGYLGRFYLKEKLYRVTFAFARMSLNATALAWTLSAVPDATPGKILPVALAMGAFSGISQYYNQAVIGFVNSPKTAHGKAMRWLGLDMFFYALGKSAATLSGLSIGSTMDILVSAFRGAVSGALTQMPLDLAIGTRGRILQQKELPQEKAKGRFFLDLRTLAVSAGATSATLAAIEVPGGQMAQAVVLTYGLFDYFRMRRCEAAFMKR